MAMHQKAFLTTFAGTGKVQRFPLNLKTVSIGRDPNNSISVRDGEASRIHAQIRKEGDKHRVVDLNSSNGLFVNENRVKEKVLEHEDLVRIGKTLFRFEVDSESYSRFAVSGSSLNDPNVLVDDDLFPQIEPRLVPIDRGIDVLLKISEAISQTRDLNDLLKKIVALVFEWTQADRACILLDDGSSYRVASSMNRAGEQLRSINISRTLLEKAKRNLETVFVSSSKDDDELQAAKSFMDSGIHQLICVPISYRDQLHGFIYVDTLNSPTAGLFVEEHVKLMAAVGQQTAVAIENHLHYTRMMENRQMAAVGEAMTGLSHQIKNILQGIHGGAHIINNELGDESGDAQVGCIKKGWAIVQRNQDKISQLVMDMLSFGKSPDLDLRLVDLNAIIGKQVKSFRGECREEAIEFLWKPNRNIDSVMVDRKAISQAVENVIRNAVDACRKKESGQIEILVEQTSSPAEIRIAIHDNGCGIAEESLPNIFSLFESSKGGRSTGIGLTVAQKLVREHLGEIQVTSTEGVGSEFTIIIPDFGQQNTSDITLVNTVIQKPTE